jgi:hypothetical protein
MSDGMDWMSWSPATREVYLGGFFMGYLYGTVDTCVGVHDLWLREGEPVDPEMKQLPSDVATKCQSRVDGFTKLKVMPDGSPDYSPYTGPITAFYKKNPEEQHVRIDYMILQLRDSNYDEGVRHDTQKEAGK